MTKRQDQKKEAESAPINAKSKAITKATKKIAPKKTIAIKPIIKPSTKVVKGKPA